MYSQLSVIGWFEVFPFLQMLFSIQCPTSPQHLQPSYKENNTSATCHHLIWGKHLCLVWGGGGG